MAITTHGDPEPLHLNHDDEELWDLNIEALLSARDIDGARAEFERQCIASRDSGDPIQMTPETWEELRLELHREANIPS